MKYSELECLYEKLYFTELDIREKLTQQLQTPLAILIAETGALSFIIDEFTSKLEGKALDSIELNIAALIYFLVFPLGILFLIDAFHYFSKTWHKHTYKLIPSSEAIESYKNNCLELVKNRSDAEDLVKSYMHDYLIDAYIRCGSECTKVNEQRYAQMFKFRQSIIRCTILFGISFITLSFIGI